MAMGMTRPLISAKTALLAEISRTIGADAGAAAGVVLDSVQVRWGLDGRETATEAWTMGNVVTFARYLGWRRYAGRLWVVALHEYAHVLGAEHAIGSDTALMALCAAGGRFARLGRPGYRARRKMAQEAVKSILEALAGCSRNP